MIESVVDVREEDMQRPLVLLVTARRAEGEARILAVGGDGGRERRPRALAVTPAGRQNRRP